MASSASSNACVPPFLRPPSIPQPSPARIQALYAFTSSQRVSNPTGFASNLAFWAAAIEYSLGSGLMGGDGVGGASTGAGTSSESRGKQVSSSTESVSGTHDRLVLFTSSLPEQFEYNGQRPKGLGSVLEDQVSKNRLYNMTAFNSSLQPILAPPSLTSRFITRPLWWALSQINPFSASSSSSSSIPTSAPKEETLWKRYQGEYVHLPLLKKSAAKFMAYIELNPPVDYTSTLYSPRSFAQTFGPICLPLPKSATDTTLSETLSPRDCDVLIKWLTRDVGIVASDPVAGVIKIIPTASAIASSDGVKTDESQRVISEADKGAVAVLETLQKVEEQIVSIEKESIKSLAKAKHHLAQNQRSVALSYLRSKKRLDDLLAKRVGAAEQLRAVIVSLNQAKGDVEIMRAYELSASILSQTLAHPSLSPEHIAETTDALADAMADQREIEEAVKFAGGAAISGEIDDEEIAKELEQMVIEEKEKKEDKEKDIGKEIDKGSGKARDEKSEETESEQKQKPNIINEGEQLVVPEKHKKGNDAAKKADDFKTLQETSKKSEQEEEEKSRAQPEREAVLA